MPDRSGGDVSRGRGGGGSISSGGSGDGDDGGCSCCCSWGGDRDDGDAVSVCPVLVRVLVRRGPECALLDGCTTAAGLMRAVVRIGTGITWAQDKKRLFPRVASDFPPRKKRHLRAPFWRGAEMGGGGEGAAQASGGDSASHRVAWHQSARGQRKRASSRRAWPRDEMAPIPMQPVAAACALRRRGGERRPARAGKPLQP